MLSNHKFTYGQLKFEKPIDVELNDDNMVYPHGQFVREKIESRDGYNGYFTGVQADGSIRIKNASVSSFGIFDGGVKINKINKQLEMNFVGWGYASQPVFVFFESGDDDIQDRSPMQDSWGFFQCNAVGYFLNGRSRFWGLSEAIDDIGTGKFGIHISENASGYYIGTCDSEEPYVGILDYLNQQFGVQWNNERPEDVNETELKEQLWQQFCEEHSGFSRFDCQLEETDHWMSDNDSQMGNRNAQDADC